MLQAVRQRTSATMIVAVLALVFAITGGAFAATHYLITSTKQISPKVLKQLKGKRGHSGPEGKQGPAGKDGANGKDGMPGEKGTNGTNGATGESVVSTALAAKDPKCPEGGTKFTIGGKETFACNGKAGVNGKSVTLANIATGCSEGGITVKIESSTTSQEVCNGKEGKPGPVTEVLPSHVTVRGLWGHTDGISKAFTQEMISASFPFRVENAAHEGPIAHYVRKMPSTGHFGVGTQLIGPGTGTGDLTMGSTTVRKLGASNEGFVVHQVVTGEGIPANTTITFIGEEGEPAEKVYHLSNAATETKTGDSLTGTASKVLRNVSTIREGEPTVGEPISGGSIPVGATITKLISEDEVEISALPTNTEETAVTISDPHGCTGGDEEPGAEPGHLCVFVNEEENVLEEKGLTFFEAHIYRSGPTGFTTAAVGEEEGTFLLNGSWAVTAE